MSAVTILDVSEVFRNFYGPTHKAYSALDVSQQLCLTEGITQLLERLNVAGKSSLVVPGEYLEIVITKTRGESA